jgi:single-strand DNA-binding protein
MARVARVFCLGICANNLTKFTMAMSLNRVQLIGNLTREPEMKQIPGGATVTSFGVATNLSWTDQSGNKQDKVEFHNIVAWRKLAEICGQYLKKGSKVFIEGRLQTRDWEAEDGTKKYRTEIVADNMIMLDRKGDYDPSANADRESAGIKSESTSEAKAPADSGEPVAAGKEDVSVDDLPF